MLTHVKGNLLAPHHGETVIAHGVNTMGRMGAGFALALSSLHPDMVAGYRRACLDGTLMPGGCWTWTDGRTTVHNLATQQYYGARGRATSEWVRASLLVLRYELDAREGKHVAMPRIASGLGGMEWNEVLRIVETTFQDWDGMIRVYSL